MCVYNTPQRFLLEAVKSIIDQTYKNIELIIVDDCSSNELFNDAIFKNKKIKIIRNKENHGPSYSRNRALTISNGEYIAIMDSDDISLPTRIEKQVKFMEENNHVVACGTWFKYIGSKNHEIKRCIDDNDYYRCCLLFGNSPTLLNSSVMIRKETIDKNGIKYDEQLRYGEDYKIWCQLSKLGVVTNYKEVLVYYRVHDSQMTRSKDYAARSKFHSVGDELIKEIGADFTEEEKELFFNYFGNKRNNANRYSQLLDRLSFANRISNIYNQEKLELRIYEQWVFLVKSIKNPFKFFDFLLKQKGRRKEIIKIKKNQIFRK